MFFGEYRHNLDAKGRLTLPAEFRNELGNAVYITKGFEGCLSVYTESEFMTLLERLSKLKDTNGKQRAFKRIISANSRKLEFDKMGRINIPDMLCKQAELSKNCVVLGSFDHIEIWDAAKWESYYAENEPSYEEVAEAAFADED